MIDTIDDIRRSFKTLQSEMNSIAQRIDDIKSLWRQTRPNLKISQEIVSATQEYEGLLVQLSAADAGDPSAYALLVNQRQDLEDQLKGIVEKREIIRQYQADAKDYLDNLKKHRAKLTELRDKFLKNTLAGNSYVRIEVSVWK